MRCSPFPITRGQSQTARRGGLAALLALALAGCGDVVVTDEDGGSSSGPGDIDITQDVSQDVDVTQDVDTGDIENEVEGGPTRVDVDVDQGGGADEVKLDDGATYQDEKIRGRVIGVDRGRSAIVVEIDALVVFFDARTVFKDEDGDEISVAVFLAFIEAELAAGRTPGVECRRQAGDHPQDPYDSVFIALEIRLDPDCDELEIDMNIDSDQIVRRDDRVFIIVLAIEIEIRQGDTNVIVVAPPCGEDDCDDDCDDGDCDEAPHQSIELTLAVIAVDVDKGLLMLSDGTIVRVVGDTSLEADSDDELESLEELRDALDRGWPVEADCYGLIEDDDPLVVIAIELELVLVSVGATDVSSQDTVPDGDTDSSDGDPDDGDPGDASTGDSDPDAGDSSDPDDGDSSDPDSDSNDGDSSDSDSDPDSGEGAGDVTGTVVTSADGDGTGTPNDVAGDPGTDVTGEDSTAPPSTSDGTSSDAPSDPDDGSADDGLPDDGGADADSPDGGDAGTDGGLRAAPSRLASRAPPARASLA